MYFSYQLFQSHLLKRWILYPLRCLETFIQNQSILYKWIYFWLSILFHWNIYICLFLCQFQFVLIILVVLIIESSLNCYFPFQNTFSYLRTIFISIYILESAFEFLQRTCCYFDWNYNECTLNLGWTDVLLMLTLPNHKQVMSLQLLRLSLILHSFIL